MAVDPLLLSLRDAVRQGGDFLSSHIRAYEHRILEIQAQIKERNRNFAHVARASSYLEQQVVNLKLEQDTWKLLDYLHKCELRHQSPPTAPSYFSEKELAQWFNLNDKSLDWDSSVVAWSESLHTPFVNVKGAPSQRMSVEKLRVQTELQRRVESLDPDAQLRGHLEVEQEEEQLLADLWSLLRGGLLSRAVELCRDYNQHWRAASLGGGEYWYDACKENQPTAVEGNRRRLLWRTSCRELAKASPSLHERGIYAVLSGDLDLVLHGETLCQSWDDVCWAKFRTMVALNIDKKLQTMFRPCTATSEHSLQHSLHDDLGYAQAGPARIESRQSILQELETEFHVTVDNLSMRYHHILHQLINQRTPRQFAADLTFLLFHAEFGNLLFLPQNASYLAFIVHLHIYSKYFSAVPTKDIPNSQEEDFLLAFYIVYLVSTKTYDVPSPQEQGTIVDYFIYLPRAKKIRLYAKFLQGLGFKSSKRSHFLQAAEMSFPEDVAAITVQLVNNLRVERGDYNTTSHVLDKMDALRWLALQKGCDENIALSHANHLFRLFWEWKSTLDSLTLPENFKPFSRDELLVFGLRLSEDVSKLRPNRTTREGWEFTCWTQYYGCLKRFEEFQQHSHQQPQEAGPQHAQWEAVRDRAAEDSEKWIRSTLELCAQRIGTNLKCVPELVDLLAQTFMSCENYQQCTNLANDVADHGLRLYEFFAQDEMEHFLGSIRAAFLETLPTEQVKPPLAIHH